MRLRLKILNGSLYALAGAIVIMSLVTAYILLVPIHVLTDWAIEIPDQKPAYSIGDTFFIQSTYTKERNVNGIAKRHLECTSPGLSNVSYPLSDATANHPTGSRTGTGVLITLPKIPVPAKCFISIDVTYQIYPFRSVTEYNRTKSFEVVQ